MSQPFMRAVRPRVSPAREIQNDVRQLKHSIDEAMASGGDLIAKVIRIARQTELTPYDTHRAIEQATACLSAGLTMRTASLAAHDELRQLGGRINLKELGWGDLICPPEHGGLTDAENPAPLRVVTAAG